MRTSVKAGLTALLTVAVLAASAVAANAGTIQKVGSGTAYTGPVTARSISATTTLVTTTGTITCSQTAGNPANPAFFGYGSITTSTVPAAFASVGSLTAGKFGNPLNNPNQSTPANPCPTNIPQLVSCAASLGTQNVTAQEVSGAVSVRLVLPANAVTLTCANGTITCRYQGTVTGTTTTGNPDLTFASQTVTRSVGSPAVCPASGQFNSVVNLFGTASSAVSGGSTAPADRLAVY